MAKKEPMITTEGQARRIMALIERLQALPPTIKGIDVELKALRALSDLYGLNSRNVHHMHDQGINIAFVGMRKPEQLPPADSLPLLPPEQEKHSIGFVSLKHGQDPADPSAPFASYSYDELINDPEDPQDPPEGSS